MKKVFKLKEKKRNDEGWEECYLEILYRAIAKQSKEKEEQAKLKEITLQ